MSEFVGFHLWRRARPIADPLKKSSIIGIVIQSSHKQEYTELVDYKDARKCLGFLSTMSSGRE